MPTIERRTHGNGTTTFRARVRMHGARSATATFSRKTDAIRWAQATEADIRAGRYFKGESAPRHTLREALDRNASEVFRATRASPSFKRHSSHGGAGCSVIFGWWI